MSNGFEERTREILDESIARLDGRTRSRLTQARHAALAKLDRPAREKWRAWLPLGASAAAAVLAVTLWLGQAGDRPAPLVANGGALEDIDLLADAEAPDFVSDPEDIEFYEWAASEIES